MPEDGTVKMSSNNSDWDSILEGLEKGTPKKNVRQGNAFGGLVVYGGVVAFCALMVMNINSVLISAWPNMEWMSPGIGYWASVKICAMVWAILSLKALLQGAAIIAANKTD